jgi:hypothetical protein
MKNNPFFFLSLASLTLAACGVGAEKNDSNTSTPTASPELQKMKEKLPSLGHGVDFTTGTVVGECVTGTPPSASIVASGNGLDEFNPDGQIVSATVEEIKSSSELRKRLQVTASGKGSFGLTSASGNASFFRDQEVSQHTYNLLLHAHVENPEVKMHNVKLTPEAQKLLLEQGADALIKRCGSDVVIGYQTGGDFAALIKIASLGSQTVQEIRADIALRGLNFSAGASLVNSSSEVSKHYTLSIDSSVRGGKGEKIGITPEELKKQFQSFPQIALKSAVPFRLVTLPLRTLVASADTLAHEKRRAQISEVANMFDETHDHITDLRYVLSTDKSLSDSERQTIKDDIEKLSKNRQLLEVALATCEYHDKPCSVPEKLDLKDSKFRILTEIRTDAQCGVALYNEGTSASVCETYEAIKNIPEKRQMVKISGPECGVKRYNERMDKMCGCSNPVGMKFGDSCARRTCSRPEFGVAEYHTCQKEKLIQAARQVKETLPKTCRAPQFGVKDYKSCRLPKLPSSK